MLATTSSVTLAACLSISIAAAQSPGENGAVQDARLDWYEIESRPDLVRYAEVSAMLVPRSELQDQGDGFFRLTTDSWVLDSSDFIGPGAGAPPCPDVNFSGQQAIGGGASGTLVGRDLFLLAGHTMPSSGVCANRALVFGFRQLAQDDPPVFPAPGTYPGYVLIPATDVYSCAEIVASDLTSDGGDWAVVRVDRDVSPDRVPVPINRRYVPNIGTDVVAIGHPFRLTQKFEPTQTTFRGVAPERIQMSALTRMGGGSSGSGVFNLVTGRLEGYVRSAQLAFVYVPDDDCWTDYAHPLSAGIPHTLNAAAAIPELGISVDNLTVAGVEDPDAVVEHLGFPGGPFTSTPTTYRVSGHGPGLLRFEVRQSSATQGAAPILINGQPGPVFDSMMDGQTRDYAITVNPSVASKPLDELVTLEFIDHTYSIRDRRMHRVEIGDASFVVEPNDDFDGDGPGARDGESITWTLRNRYAVPLELHPAFFVRFVVPSVTPQRLDLPPLGEGTMTMTMPALSDFSPFVFEALMGFEDSRPTDFRVMRRLRLDHGRLDFAPTQSLPIEIPPNSTVEATFQIPSPMTVQDVDLALHISVRHAAQAELIAPDGTSVRLLDVVDGFDSHLLFDADTPDDDETLTPIGDLDRFDGRVGDGTWRLRVQIQGDSPGLLQQSVLRLLPHEGAATK